MDLYCDDKYIRDSVISAEFIGSVTGLILLSILADRLGRKVIIVSTLYLCCMGAICKLCFY
jgi:MFS family permease